MTGLQQDELDVDVEPLQTDTHPEMTVWVVATNYADDPHPHVEGVFADEDDADEMMEKCRNRFEGPHATAWQKIEMEVQ